MYRCLLQLLIAAVCLGGIASCGQPVEEDYGPVGEFALTERSGKVVSDGDLRGKVWIASFVFTRCTGPCPQISGSIARLQSELKDQPDVRFVTFTVDPEHDDREELARYAEHFQADPQRWLFLTGKQDDVYRLLQEGFKVPVAQNVGEDRKPGMEVMHSQKVVVVDRRGHIRGWFTAAPDLNDPDADRAYEANMKRIRQAVASLLREAS
jgi:cytochrome oxidase Cu insertion factor (SCO1/SenC/PrrC family)